MGGFIRELYNNHAIQGVQWLDVLVAAVPIYLGLRALHRATHRRVVIFFLSLFFLYCAAKAYHWQLTSVFLEYFGLVGLVGLFVLFQEDMRRFLESLMYSPIFSIRKKQVRNAANITGTLVPIIQELANRKTGALIAVEGRIPLTHHAKGGVVLNGEISSPLILSIFDSHSAGHDGAIVVRNQKIAKFGAHLPLPRGSQGISGKLGTRHAAALGLTQVSDAFVIVVSEETGQISIAQDGALIPVDATQLFSHLARFFESRLVPGDQVKVMSEITRHWRTKAASVVLSLTLWMLFVAPVVLEQRTFEVPLALKNVPKNLIIEYPDPNRFLVTLEGPETLFKRWNENARVLQVDVTGAKQGSWRAALDRDSLELPEGLKVKRVEPPAVHLTAYRSKVLEVPVAVSLVGRKPEKWNYKVRVEPERVPIVIREGDVGPSLVTTEPVDFTKLQQQREARVKLIAPNNSQFSSRTPDSIRVVAEKASGQSAKL